MEFKLSLRTLIFGMALTQYSFTGNASPLPTDSLFQTSYRGVNASGNEFQLKDLRGKPALVTMVYTKCQYTCPMIVTKLKTIEKAIAGNPDLTIVLVSFDQKNDTPQTLKNFMREEGLDERRWIVLAGKNSGSIRELAALLDISYKVEKNGDYSHSNVIALLDKDGVKILSLNGIAADHAPLVKAARDLR